MENIIVRSYQPEKDWASWQEVNRQTGLLCRRWRNSSSLEVASSGNCSLGKIGSSGTKSTGSNGKTN